MAPELLNSEKFGEKRARPTQPADIYAFGMVIYEVLTRSDPFYDYNPEMIQLLILISDGARPRKPNNAEEIGFGSGTWELVKECWRDEPTSRPKIKQVLVHLARKTSGMGIQKPPASDYLPSVSCDHQLVSVPERIILPQWQHLASQRSISSNLPQIKALVDDVGNRESVLKSEGGDAAVVINTLDKVSRPRALMSTVAVHSPSAPKILKEDQVPIVTKSHAFKLMRKLAGASRQVPKSYLVGSFSRLKVEETIVASGGFAEIRKGRYRGVNVAVKTIRISLGADIKAIHKVRRAV